MLFRSAAGACPGLRVIGPLSSPRHLGGDVRRGLSDAWQCADQTVPRTSTPEVGLNGAEVLLLDEITSALDRDTATQVMRSVFALDGTTRIVVTHSLEKSQLKLFDAIIVLRWGSICECGRFDELMQKNGYFKALYTVG